MLNFLFETLRLGIKNLRLHKLRSLLTALGIILGVAAVIIMVAIGEGGKRAALKQVEQLGARNIVVRSIKPPETNDASARAQRVLDYGVRRADLERLKTIPGIRTIVPLRDTEQKVVLKDMRINANAIATTPDIFQVINLRLEKGHYFSRLQYERSAAVCVLGSVAARQLFPYQDPLYQTIQVGTSGRADIMLTVIGVLEPTGLRRLRQRRHHAARHRPGHLFPAHARPENLRRRDHPATGRVIRAQADRADGNLAGDRPHRGRRAPSRRSRPTCSARHIQTCRMPM